MTIKGFYKKYQGRMLENAGCYNSQEYLQFAKDLRSTIKGVAKEMEAKIEKYTIGHYYISGFINKNGKYVYFSYDFPRHKTLDLQSQNSSDGILIRTAKTDSDFKGGPNHFCNIFTMKDVAKKLLHLAAHEEK